MPDYTVLIVGETDRWWTSMNLKERKDGYAQYAAFGQALREGSHEIIDGAELTQSDQGHVIPAGGGPATEGPYAETTEQVGGFYHVRTDDLDGLLECCQIIAKVGDRVEVRRNVDPSERPK